MQHSCGSLAEPENKLDPLGIMPTPTLESAMNRNEQQDAIGFTCQVARALASYGTPSHRLESLLQILTSELGMPGTFSATSTLVLFDFDLPDGHQVRVERIELQEVDLSRLSRLDILWNLVADRKISPKEGLAQIEALLKSPPAYGLVSTWTSWVMASGAASAFFGGGLAEIALGSIAGALLGTLDLASTRFASIKRMFLPLAAALVALTATVLHPWFGNVDVDGATLGGIIVLVPGFSLTIGVSELVTNNTAAGVSRLGSALMSALLLAAGVLFGRTLGVTLVGPIPIPDVSLLPFWAIYLAIPFAALSISILFRAPKRDLGWIGLVSALGFLTLEVMRTHTGMASTVFIAALVVGVSSNAYARILDRPAAITRLPALLFLVPGSLSFLSLSSLITGASADALASAGQMAIIVTALVTGLLLASTVLPPKKEL
jgi:uncharacterized membrane protein YjjP (DUF1212 family)